MWGTRISGQAACPVGVSGVVDRDGGLAEHFADLLTASAAAPLLGRVTRVVVDGERAAGFFVFAAQQGRVSDFAGADIGLTNEMFSSFFNNVL